MPSRRRPESTDSDISAAFSASPLPEAFAHQVGEPLAGHPLDNPAQQACAGDMPQLPISLASGSHSSMTVSTGARKSSPLFGDDITRTSARTRGRQEFRTPVSGTKNALPQ